MSDADKGSGPILPPFPEAAAIAVSPPRPPPPGTPAAPARWATVRKVDGLPDPSGGARLSSDEAPAEAGMACCSGPGLGPTIAFDHIHRACNGLPRPINPLAHVCLMAAAARQGAWSMMSASRPSSPPSGRRPRRPGGDCHAAVAVGEYAHHRRVARPPPGRGPGPAAPGGRPPGRWAWPLPPAAPSTSWPSAWRCSGRRPRRPTPGPAVIGYSDIPRARPPGTSGEPRPSPLIERATTVVK